MIFNWIKTQIKKTRNPAFIDFCKRVSFWFRPNNSAEHVLAKIRKKSAHLSPVTSGDKVSILVSVWNTELDYLREMLDSVRNQSYQNWELCINNASDDRHHAVGELLARYAGADARIKVMKTENHGIAVNSDTAATIATGEFILLMDHDDFLVPYTIAAMMNKQAAENADFVYADEYRYFIHYKCVSRTKKGRFSREALWHDNFINHPVLFRRALFEKVGGFREGYDGSQDHELYFRLTENTERIAYVPEPLYFWRINKISFSQQHLVRCIQSGKKALSEHLARINVSANIKASDVEAVYTVTLRENSKNA